MAKTPDQVFTPRESKINEAMYVARPALEQRLANALRGTQHVIIHGESGSGKSWLYKKVLADLDAGIFVANLANASRLGSVTAEIKNVVDRTGRAAQVGYSEMKSTTADAVFAQGSLEHSKEFSVGEKEPFEVCCMLARSAAKAGVACIVLDNLETIFDDAALMKELANIIILLDDERYAQYRVRLLIVGVPTGIRDYFARTPNMATILSRLYEIPEVARFTPEQTADLVRRGFIQELEYACRSDVLDRLITHVTWVSDRLPQRVHEYCLEVARLAAPRSAITDDLLEQADVIWLESSLAAAYSAVEAFLNERETKLGRRNQTLYAIGVIDATEFRYSEVEQVVSTTASDRPPVPCFWNTVVRSIACRRPTACDLQARGAA